MKLRQWLGSTLVGLSLVAARADDALPWSFGMSPDQVVAVDGFGPYRRFKSGDVETFKGIYDGHEENFQFFFSDGKLQRIGVYLYEGKDLQQASRKWLSLRDSLAQKYGKIDTPENDFGDVADDRARDAFVARATQVLEASTKAQMAPKAQPAWAFVFASLFRADLERERTYYVVLYFNPPR
jgi:hypothetical protein